MTHLNNDGRTVQTNSTNAELAEEFSRQAEWRREKALQYPNDKRNAEAAAIFDRLASSANFCPAHIVAATRDLFEDYPASEEWQSMLKEVGFWSFPATAEEFCRGFIARQTADMAAE